jgi:predicted dienelactone hydrolase
MRVVRLALMLLIAVPTSIAWGAPRPFHAGIAHLTIADTPAFDALIWYPTETTETAWQEGPFAIAASRDAPVASGRFPIVLFSHGGGAGGGTPLVARELAASLARAGFFVVAPFHGNTWPRVQVRRRQVGKALDAVLADPRFKDHADSARIGMIGFSLGGAVTLMVAGAVPDYAHLLAYCQAHADDPLACSGTSNSGSDNATSTRQPPAGAIPVFSPLLLKAIVLMDPLAAPFYRDGLTSVNMPVLLYRPERSALKAEGNALALAAALPRAPRQQTVPGGHFVFVDPCPRLLQAEAPDVCQDPPGVDRAAVHRRLETEIAEFLRDNL